MKIKATVLISIAGALVLVIYSLNILFSDGMSFAKGSYKYWITINSDAIKFFPIVEPVENPVYFYSSGDGPSPSLQEVTYTSRADESKLESSLGVFLAAQGFEDEGNIFIKGNDEVSVTYILKANSLIEVRATHTSRPPVTRVR